MRVANDRHAHVVQALDRRRHAAGAGEVLVEELFEIQKAVSQNARARYQRRDALRPDRVVRSRRALQHRRTRWIAVIVSLPDPANRGLARLIHHG